MSRMQRDVIDVIDEHERAIRRLQAALTRAPNLGGYLNSTSEINADNITSGQLAVGRYLLTGTSFPGTADDGQLVYRTDENIFYRYDAANNAWIPLDVVSDPARLGDGILSTTHFASGIEPIQIVAALGDIAVPTAGQVAYLTTDKKLYRYDGATWTSEVPTTDLTGTITGVQIEDGSVSAAKFASGLEPVQIVSALPVSATEGEVVYLTTDKKLYRYDGTTWTVAVDGADIVANSITAGQIAAGAITADELAANAVRIGSMDPTLAANLMRGFAETFEGTTAQLANNYTFGTGTIVPSTESEMGGNVLATTGYTIFRALPDIYQPLDPDAMYRMRVRYRNKTVGSNNETIYVGIRTTDENRSTYADSSVVLSAHNPSDTAWHTATGYFRLGDTASDSAGSRSPNSPFLVRNTARYYAPTLLVNYDTNDGGEWEIDYFVIDPIYDDASIGTTTIVDGSIVTDHMTANTINGDRITAGTLAASKIVANSIQTGQIAAGAITADELASINLSVGKFIRSNSYTPGVSGWSIAADGSAEFNNIKVRGDVVSGNWDGADPANLVSPDSTATHGFYLDASTGGAQFMGMLDVGGQAWFGGHTSSGDLVYIHGSNGVMEWQVPYPSPLQTPVTFANISQGLDGDVAGTYPASTMHKWQFTGADWDNVNYPPAYLEIVGANDQAGYVRIGNYPMSDNGVVFRQGIIMADYGGAGAPTYSWGGDENTGMFHYTSDAIGFSTGGTMRFLVYGASSLIGYLPFHAQFGSAMAPSFSFQGDPGTGMYRYGANSLGLVNGGVLRMYWEAPDRWNFNGSVLKNVNEIHASRGGHTDPSYTFTGYETTGMYHHSFNTIGFAIQGQQAIQLTRASATDYRIFFGNEHNDFIKYDTNIEQWQFVNNGAVELYLSGTQFIVPNVYNDYGGGSANVKVGTNGRLQRSASARRYKKNIKDALRLHAVTLRPVEYDFKKGGHYFGLIADDVADELPEAGVYDEGGTVVDYDTRAVIAVLAAKVNRLETMAGVAPQVA